MDFELRTSNCELGNVMGDVVSYVNLRRFAPCDVRRSTFIKGDVVKGDVVSYVNLLILRDRGTGEQAETGNR